MNSVNQNNSVKQIKKEFGEKNLKMSFVVMLLFRMVSTDFLPVATTAEQEVIRIEKGAKIWILSTYFLFG